MQPIVEKFLLYKFLSHNPKSTIVLYKNEKFPKIAVFVKIIEKCNLLVKNSERILFYQNKFLLSLFLSHNPKSITVLYKNENFPKYQLLKKNYFKNAIYERKNLKEYLYINKNYCYPNF